MNLDDQLRSALHDERLALPVPAHTLDVVRRKRRTRQVLGVSGASLSAVAVVAGAVALSPSGGTRVAQVGTTPSTTVAGGCDAPAAGQLEGSSYVVRSARDWFMTKAQSDQFFSHYDEPSPKPQDTVPSPQPSGAGTDRLVAALLAAGAPGVDRLARCADSIDGHRARLIEACALCADRGRAAGARHVATGSPRERPARR